MHFWHLIDIVLKVVDKKKSKLRYLIIYLQSAWDTGLILTKE